MTIRNPIEWATDQLKLAGLAVGSASRAGGGAEEEFAAPLPEVRQIGVADLRDSLARGFDDFAAYRTDVVFLCIVYPIIGLVLGRLAFGYGMLPLLFPLASGFALVGPFAAVGLYEMSRRREQGVPIGWADAFAVLRSPAIGSILVLGLVLLALFALWLFAAWFIYLVTLGPDLPISASAFANDVLTTKQGWTMTAIGMGVGFLFALVVLVISVVSFPLLLDRNVGVYRAIATSLRAVRENPRPMAAWGLIIAGGLLIGAIPLLVGLAIALPILGHATWHLYRKVVA